MKGGQRAIYGPQWRELMLVLPLLVISSRGHGILARGTDGEGYDNIVQILQL